MNYNLLDEPWIPVLYRNGDYTRVGIKKAFEDAGTIRQIAASNPMDRVAVLRFLLAVLLWCKNGAMADVNTLSDRGAGVHRDWLAKLEAHRAAFNLLGDGVRFYQDESLKEKEVRPIADLLVEFPGKNSVNHMRHVVHDGSYGFCPACCTLGILRLSVWAPANRFYPASVNPGSAAYAIIERENLLLSLAANLPEITTQSGEAPWLSNTPPESPDAVASLAWRPRKLWLNVADKDGHCAYCGQPSRLVRSLCIEKGWPTPVTAGQQFGKLVLAEFQKVHRDYKAKATDRRKVADKVAKIALVILKCRLPALLQADSKEAPLDESDVAKIARIFDQLFTAGSHESITGLAKKPTKEELPLLDKTDTQAKKFWAEDPHLLKETEAIGLPDLNKDVAMHTSKFWRDALRLRGAKAVAVGIVGDGQYIYHDSLAVPLPGAAATELAEVTKACADVLRGVLRIVTPNPDREHPEINAALVLLTPDTEERIRATLNKPEPTTDHTRFLHETYDSMVGHAVTSTACGSPLRRREAVTSAEHHLALLMRNLSKKQEVAQMMGAASST